MSVETRRDLLVQAAFRVIAEHGVEAATTRRISAAASMSLASFHYAFESRDELLAELVARGTSDELATFIAPLSPPSPSPGPPDSGPVDSGPADSECRTGGAGTEGAGTGQPAEWVLPADIGDLLKAGLMSYLESIIADPGRESAMITLAQYARRTKGLEHFAQRLYDRYYEIAQTTLEAAAEAMHVQWATPPSHLAPLVVAATDGLTLAYLSTGNREIAERIIDATVTMLRSHLVSP
ncbi:TetR/AcrR family transcriptional regulator [Williamsia muralis]|jgi:AcrR family transcriptional regulator|uniref:TetR/AcrR family transcriptional regulator n=1 Tax=Williamsia marianensis TaxID=85044 RepID=UPI001FAFEF63|nr:TetR family transcriptional regulator [Williamsia marianensis]